MPSISFNDVDGLAIRYYVDPASKKPVIRLLNVTEKHSQVYETSAGDYSHFVIAGKIWPADRESEWTPVTLDDLKALGAKRIEGLYSAPKKVWIGPTRSVACIEDPATGEKYHVCTGWLVRVSEHGKSYDGIVLEIGESGFVLGWFDSKNRKQSDGFGWDSDILVY